MKNIKFKYPVLVYMNIWGVFSWNNKKVLHFDTKSATQSHIGSKTFQILLFENLGTPRIQLWMKEIVLKNMLENMIFF